jgi:hypothetical protein
VHAASRPDHVLWPSVDPEIDEIASMRYPSSDVSVIIIDEDEVRVAKTDRGVFFKEIDLSINGFGQQNVVIRTKQQIFALRVPAYAIPGSHHTGWSRCDEPSHAGVPAQLQYSDRIWIGAID